MLLRMNYRVTITRGDRVLYSRGHRGDCEAQAVAAALRARFGAAAARATASGDGYMVPGVVGVVHAAAVPRPRQRWNINLSLSASERAALQRLADAYGTSLSHAVGVLLGQRAHGADAGACHRCNPGSSSTSSSGAAARAGADASSCSASVTEAT